MQELIRQQRQALIFCRTCWSIATRKLAIWEIPSSIKVFVFYAFSTMMPLHERAFLLLILSAVELFASCFVVVVGSRDCLCLVLLPGTAFSLPWSFHLDQFFPCLGPSNWKSFSCCLWFFQSFSVCLHSAILPGTVCLCWHSAILPGTPFYPEQSFSVSAPGHSTWNSLSLSELGYSTRNTIPPGTVFLCLSALGHSTWNSLFLHVCTRPLYPGQSLCLSALGHSTRTVFSLCLHSATLAETVFLFSICIWPSYQIQSLSFCLHSTILPGTPF